MDSKKKLGIAAISLAAAASVLGTASTARADDVIICDCGPAPGGGSELAPFHKISAMSKVMEKFKVMQKVETSPAFLKISDVFQKFTDVVIGPST